MLLKKIENPIRKHVRRNPRGRGRRQHNPGSVLGSLVLLGVVGTVGWVAYKTLKDDKPAVIPPPTQKVWSLTIMDANGIAFGPAAPFVGIASLPDASDQIVSDEWPTNEEAAAAIEQLVDARGDLYTWPSSL